jgi:hypothetical protein
MLAQPYGIIVWVKVILSIDVMIRTVFTQNGGVMQAV